mmetsp:Transcript_13568/g.22483  ORF Transcript_13568/g.22483 Transcript_13568/m.22483 type:complete len:352 (+) Transcript_13568:556-1611(+)
MELTYRKSSSFCSFSGVFRGCQLDSSMSRVGDTALASFFFFSAPTLLELLFVVRVDRDPLRDEVPRELLRDSLFNLFPKLLLLGCLLAELGALCVSAGSLSFSASPILVLRGFAGVTGSGGRLVDASSFSSPPKLLLRRLDLLALRPDEVFLDLPSPSASANSSRAFCLSLVRLRGCIVSEVRIDLISSLFHSKSGLSSPTAKRDRICSAFASASSDVMGANPNFWSSSSSSGGSVASISFDILSAIFPMRTMISPMSLCCSDCLGCALMIPRLVAAIDATCSMSDFISVFLTSRCLLRASRFCLTFSSLLPTSFPSIERLRLLCSFASDAKSVPIQLLQFEAVDLSPCGE